MTSTQQMKMKMPDRLTAIFVAVIDDAETTFGATAFFRQLTGNLESVPDQLIVCGRQIKRRPDMLARKNQQMGRRLGGNILNGNHLIILKHDLGRDLPGKNFTKDAIVRHVLLPSL
jgi:hypothetical protein